VHDGLEKYLRGETDTLPEEVHPSWQRFIDDIRRREGLQIEVRLDNDVAYGKLDIYIPELYLGDWKTGKVRRTDIKMREQLRFYTWLTGESILAALLWVEHPQAESFLELEVAWTTTLDKVWRNRIDKMQKGPYPKVQSWRCGWCPVKDCPHNTVKGE
jgi:hypothetical protein